jgi:hypothetical protein
MALLSSSPVRTTIVLVAACLIASLSSAAPLARYSDRPTLLGRPYVGPELAATRTPSPRSSSGDETPNTAARSAVTLPEAYGSCEELAARQALTYLDRLKAKEYSAARDLARTTADLCLEAGDFKRARDWFQTAGAVGPRQSGRDAERDAQWRRRYQEGLARVRPPQSDIAAAEARMAARRALDRGAAPSQGSRSTASKTASAAPPRAGVLINRQSEWSEYVWIVAAGGFGVFVLGASVLLRRSGVALPRRPTKGD